MPSVGRKKLIDIICAVTIIFVLYGVFAGYSLRNMEEARKAALRNQLTNLRYSIELYKALEGSYPGDLRILGRGYIRLKDSRLYGRKYLELQPQDKEGYPIDPYGKRFIYDSGSGKVRAGGKDENEM